MKTHVWKRRDRSHLADSHAILSPGAIGTRPFIPTSKLSHSLFIPYCSILFFSFLAWENPASNENLSPQRRVLSSRRRLKPQSENSFLLLLSIFARDRGGLSLTPTLGFFLKMSLEPEKRIYSLALQRGASGRIQWEEGCCSARIGVPGKAIGTGKWWMSGVFTHWNWWG